MTDTAADDTTKLHADLEEADETIGMLRGLLRSTQHSLEQAWQERDAFMDALGLDRHDFAIEMPPPPQPDEAEAIFEDLRLTERVTGYRVTESRILQIIGQRWEEARRVLRDVLLYGSSLPSDLVKHIEVAVKRVRPVETDAIGPTHRNVMLKPGPCAKQTVTATLVATDSTRFTATNICMTPQASCPRTGMATGQGYELCRDVCHQPAHAEVNAVALAGAKAKGGTLYIVGHTYACTNCVETATKAGVFEIIVGEPPKDLR